MEKMLLQQLKVIFVEEYFILSLISYLMLCWDNGDQRIMKNPSKGINKEY